MIDRIALHYLMAQQSASSSAVRRAERHGGDFIVLELERDAEGNEVARIIADCDVASDATKIANALNFVVSLTGAKART